MKKADLRCYVITAGVGERVVHTASQAARAGAGTIQIRAKDLSARDLTQFATAVARGVQAANPATRVLIDDRADVAYAIGLCESGLVHGVHLGQDDLSVKAARAMLGPDAIIGLTTGTRELVEGANDVADIIDYIGAGPFRLTPTKDSGRPALGVQGYAPLVALSRVPVVAIGDVQPEDTADLAATGVAGVAVVRAVMDAADPGDVVRRILREFEADHRS